MKPLFPVLLLLLGLAFAGMPGRAHAAAPAAAPASLCAAQGTDDTLHPVPEALASAVNQAFGTAMPAAVVAQTSVYRCDAGQVLVCSAGANLNCGKADTSRVPNAGELSWCQQSPQADYIPAYVTGHETVFSWRCQDGKPEIARQVLAVDRRGFVSDFWKTLP